MNRCKTPSFDVFFDGVPRSIEVDPMNSAGRSSQNPAARADMLAAEGAK